MTFWYPKPQTLSPSPQALHLKPYTLYPAMQTFNRICIPESSNLNPKAQTPELLTPKPQPLNPYA